MIRIVELKDVVIDERARNGVWCQLPYPNHPRGCPNYGRRDTCPPRAPRFEDLLQPPFWLVAYPFDLRGHAEMMKEKHPKWSERQARCVLYWQGRVRKYLRLAIRDLREKLGDDYIILEIPEANGVNCFATCAKVGLYLKRNPDLVWKMMIVGRKK